MSFSSLRILPLYLHPQIKRVEQRRYLLQASFAYLKDIICLDQSGEKAELLRTHEPPDNQKVLKLIEEPCVSRLALFIVTTDIMAVPLGLVELIQVRSLLLYRNSISIDDEAPYPSQYT